MSESIGETDTLDELKSTGHNQTELRYNENLKGVLRHATL